MTYMNWELDFLQTLQSIHSPILNKIMLFITMLGNVGWIWLVVGVIMICIKKYRKCGIVLLLSLILSQIVGNELLKNLIARDRPCWLFDNYEQLLKVPTSFSFPSGHAQGSFCAAFSILLMHRKEGIGAIVLAGLIGFSRLYLFVHWPTDVLGGIAIAFVLASLSCLIINYIWKLLPKKHAD